MVLAGAILPDFETLVEQRREEVADARLAISDTDLIDLDQLILAVAPDEKDQDAFQVEVLAPSTFDENPDETDQHAERLTIGLVASTMGVLAVCRPEVVAEVYPREEQDILRAKVSLEGLKLISEAIPQQEIAA